MFRLYDYQIDAINRLQNGSILCGGVGSGKSLTAIGYYYLQQGGSIAYLTGEKVVNMKKPKDLYIITTARKRDDFEWEGELHHFLMSSKPEENYYKNKIVIDSWNNIQKYRDVEDAFFIFDEQRVVGYGAWAKAFIKIARSNNWILLSATPGDTWQDYMAVFIANGFYRNKTEFEIEHIVYNPHVKFRQVQRYLNTGRLIRLRNRILVDMDFNRKTQAFHEDIYCNFDKHLYRDVMKKRYDPFAEDYTPIENVSALCYILRKIVNCDADRQVKLLEIIEGHPKSIIFYNFNYELDILRSLFEFDDSIEVAEWNGHKHQPIPTGERWVYLVQYTSGCEGWNCITTDTIIFFSQNYSYKVMEQASGRIDRLNTPYLYLYYYHLKARSGIDNGIERALKQKKKFNEGKFMKW